MDYKPLGLDKFWLKGYSYHGRLNPLECIGVLPDLLRKSDSANKVKIFDSGLIDSDVGFRKLYEVYSKQVFPSPLIKLELLKRSSSSSIKALDAIEDDEIFCSSIKVHNGQIFSSKTFGLYEDDLLLDDTVKVLEERMIGGREEFREAGLEIIIFDKGIKNGLAGKEISLENNKYVLKKNRNPKFSIIKNYRMNPIFEKESVLKTVGYKLI